MDDVTLRGIYNNELREDVVKTNEKLRKELDNERALRQQVEAERDKWIEEARWYSINCDDWKKEYREAKEFQEVLIIQRDHLRERYDEARAAFDAALEYADSATALVGAHRGAVSYIKHTKPRPVPPWKAGEK